MEKVESLEICGEMRIKAGEIAKDIAKILIENGYEIARKNVGFTFSEFEILRRNQ